MVDDPAAEEREGGDPACWAGEFGDYLGLDDPADEPEEQPEGTADPAPD